MILNSASLREEFRVTSAEFCSTSAEFGARTGPVNAKNLKFHSWGTQKQILYSPVTFSFGAVQFNTILWGFFCKRVPGASFVKMRKTKHIHIQLYTELTKHNDY